MTLHTNSIADARLRGRSARRALSDDFRFAASAQICNRVLHRHEFMACKTIACYLPMEEEVDTRLIIGRAWNMRKRVFVPIVGTHDKLRFVELTPDTRLTRGPFGLWVPQSGTQIRPQKIDLVITPVVAFDSSRNRIGMGLGYFDRCFAFLRHRSRWLSPKLLGVSFECQREKKIKPNPWDIPLYVVVTERN